MTMQHAYIALGSNIGDRRHYLETALDCLRKIPRSQMGKVSSVYLTEALTPDGSHGAPFLNAVCCLRTKLLPEELLRQLFVIENHLGRIRHERWGARTIDLDLIAYGERTMQGPDLTLPHPRLSEREFVLRPLQELAPEWRHPILKKTVRELLEDLADSPKPGKVLACYGSF